MPVEFGFSSGGSGAVNAPLPHFSSLVVGGATSKVHTANSLYAVKVAVTGTTTLTGLMIQNAGTVAGNLLASLYDVNGNLLGSSASTVQAGGSALQQVPFASAVVAAAGAYTLGIQFSLATATSYDVIYATPSSVIAQGAFSAPATITPPASVQLTAQTPQVFTY